MGILVVDDAGFMRAKIKNILTSNGYEVCGEAENGAVGVQKFTELRPDLTLMDVTMPVMDGMDALKEIKRIDPEANVIMCSAMGQEEFVVEAIQAGAKDFIVKPFETARLLEAVRKSLS